MLFKEQNSNPADDAIATEITITVKRNGRNGFKATFFATYDDDGWTEHSKAFPGKTIGQVKRELSLLKTDLVAKGQPENSIIIKYA